MAVDGAAVLPVADSVDDLLRGSVRREPMLTADSLSGSAFERVVVDGERCVVKYVSADADWIMRGTGDVTCRPLEVWRLGLLAQLPACIDHAVIGCAHWRSPGGHPGAALVMRDVADVLIPVDAAISIEQHLRFLDHMATMHAAFWGWQDVRGLTPLSNRYLELSPQMAETERRMGGTHPVPRAIGEGWRRFAVAAPRAATLVGELLRDPWPLVERIGEGPTVFGHGDWKLGNLGSQPDRRTVLLDWAVPGQMGPVVDLAWYLAVNCDRLPHSKDDAIAAYRDALRRQGVGVDGWWDAQLALGLLGGLVQLGWNKAGGDPAEIGWWEDWALEGAGYL
jgi:hypothetical protein